MSTLIQYLTTIHFGTGAIQQIPSLLAEHSIRRPLLVTDRALVELGMPARVPMLPAAVFAEVSTNPTEQSVLDGLEMYRAHQCDSIVAIGGGSPIDCAKCIGLLVNHPQPLEQYAVIRGGMAKISANKPPLIAIPTTAGTGSEVGRAALITMANGEKLGVISPHLIPTVAICDPELTLELPARLTAATGMDAISHCVETFCSIRDNPVADAIAIDGLVRGIRSLRHAVENGTDIFHRREVMMASLQGGLTFQKGLGMIHSLSHPLGAVPRKQLHHGTLNAIFLPHVLRYNAKAAAEKMQRIAHGVGLRTADELPD
ncbi:MAG: iron-containing alcohol dehydrogenase, partial [Planctomycetota bacterium]|nr:iron-containing alcohol dehydrogenase [Planctomycetota bacterium]